jgi:hypothetical protein
MLDTKARTQIRETRQTLLDHLRDAPGDFKALLLASVVAELDPDRDPALLAHAARANTLRAKDPSGWAKRARDQGLDVVLFGLAQGLHRAEFGADAIPVLARRCAEISSRSVILALLREYLRDREDAATGRALAAIDAAIAERTPRLAAGVIDASFVPEQLATSPHAKVRYHHDGHLAEVVIRKGRWKGRLQLDPRPGTGRYQLEGFTAGSGHLTSETYRDGQVHTTLNTPWHDGCESSETLAWTRWVAECLGSLADAV